MSHFQKGPVSQNLTTFGWAVVPTFFFMSRWKPLRKLPRCPVASMWGSGPLSLQLERPPYTVLFRIERATIICSQLGSIPTFFSPLMLNSPKSFSGFHTAYWYPQLAFIWKHRGKLISIVDAQKGLWLYVSAGFRGSIHMDATWMPNWIPVSTRASTCISKFVKVYCI